MQHFLQQDLRYLLDNPSRKDCIIGIQYSFVLLISTVAWIFAGQFFENRTYYLIALALLLLHLYVVIRKGRNILFLFRYSLLVTIPVGAAVAWGFFTDVFIAPFGAQYQIHPATVALIGSGMLASAGAAIGWFIVFLKINNPRISYILPAHTYNLHKINNLSLMFLYIFGLMTVYLLGGIVTESKSYTQGGGDLGFEFAAANSFIFLLTGLFIVSGRIIDKDFRNIVLLLSPIYILPILGGSRADFLMQFAIIMYVFLTYRRASDKKQTSFPIISLTLGAVFLYLVSMYLGHWRQIGDFSRAFDVFLESQLFITERDAGKVLSLETANQMAGHFYTVYSKLELLNQPLLYGSSYFDYLLRTPPGFLGLPRPQDLSWSMYVYEGEVMAQGGVYEVAEAFWNFWYFGAFIVPMILSYVFGTLLKKGLTNKRYWVIFLSVFIGFGLMAPRGIWYQTFAYWRLLTIAFIFYLILKLFNIKLVRVPSME